MRPSALAVPRFGYLQLDRQLNWQVGRLCAISVEDRISVIVLSPLVTLS